MGPSSGACMQQGRSVGGCTAPTGWAATPWQSVLCLAGFLGSRLHDRCFQSLLCCKGGTSAVCGNLCQRCERDREQMLRRAYCCCGVHAVCMLFLSAWSVFGRFAGQQAVQHVIPETVVLQGRES